MLNAYFDNKKKILWHPLVHFYPVAMMEVVSVK